MQTNTFTVKYAAGKTVLSEIPATLTLEGQTLRLVGKLKENGYDTVIFELSLNDIKKVTVSSANLVIFWTNDKRTYGVRPDINIKEFMTWLKANLAKTTKFTNWNMIVAIFGLVCAVGVGIIVLASDHKL